MKRNLPCLLLLAAALGLLSGCAFTQRTLYQPKLGTNHVAAHYEPRTVLGTNVMAVVRTNSAGEAFMAVQTNIVQTVTPVYYPATLSIVTNGWEIAPGVEMGAQLVGGAVNLAAPGAGTIGSYVVSGLLTLGLLYFNAKARRATGQQLVSEELNVGLIKAVEDFRQGIKLTPLGAKVDDHLINQIKANIPTATAAGVLLTQLVDANTGNTKTTADFVQSMNQPA